MENFSLKNAEKNFYKTINLSSFAQLKPVVHEPGLFSCQFNNKQSSPFLLSHPEPHILLKIW